MPNDDAAPSPNAPTRARSRGTALRVVVDTNVLVSAAIKPLSVPARAIATLARPDAAARVLYDEAIEAEYRDVLARDKFRKIDRAVIADVLDSVFAHAERIVVTTRYAGPLDDDDDRVFVSVALAAKADAIVTGNIKDYPLGLGFEVLPPSTFLARLEDASR